jgi:hypothetical protein
MVWLPKTLGSEMWYMRTRGVVGVARNVSCSPRICSCVIKYNAAAVTTLLRGPIQEWNGYLHRIRYLEAKWLFECDWLVVTTNERSPDLVLHA